MNGPVASAFVVDDGACMREDFSQIHGPEGRELVADAPQVAAPGLRPRPGAGRIRCVRRASSKGAKPSSNPARADIA